MKVKVTIPARVVKVHEGYHNKSGKLIRDVDVITHGGSNFQYYRLTEVEEMPRQFLPNHDYEFTVFLNGMNRRGVHFNSLLIHKVTEP
jgi:hypothetical protein